MADERVNSIEELRRMQEAAQAQGSTVTNYNEWEQILQDFEDAGIQSTGSYSGDKQLYNRITQRLQEYVEQAQEEQQVEQSHQKQFEGNVPENISKNDSEQALKATVANGVSSTITSDLMKYYHNLM